ncbi:MAG TPA: hypothetical protein GYA10_05820 [Alphaproteobacteria bacterium]|nr:hypothetical protein [Alphaproteobacteria bacterium]
MAAAPAAGLPAWLFRACALLLIAVKVAYWLIAPPTEDEAYYWLWGQHLDLSYFDHSPMVGWAMGLAGRLLGWELFAVRLGNLVCLFGVALVFRHWAKRLAAADWRRVFWATLSVYLATPVIFAVTTLAWPDNWLLLFSFLALHWFGCSFAAQIDEGRLARRDLYLGALFLGLAALSKYNAVLLGSGIALTVLLTPRLRPLLRSPHLYLSALLSVAVLAPILLWNAQHDFLSLRFQLYERHGEGTFAAIHWGELARFLILSALYASPFLLVPIAVLLIKRPGTGLLGALHRIGKPTVILSFLPSLYMALFVPTSPHWAITALLVPVALAAWSFWSRWLLLAHLAFGTLLCVAAAGYYMHYAFVNFGGDGEAARFYGWDQVGARMRQLAAEQGAATTLAAYRWEVTSKLGFALRTTDVTSLAPSIDQFDFWRDEEALRGQDIVIVDEFGNGPAAFAPRFERVEVLEQFTVELFGTPLASYPILIGRDYRPQPRP